MKSNKRMSPAELWETCIHAAATAVVAYVLGAGYEDIFVNDDGEPWTASSSKVFVKGWGENPPADVLERTATRPAAWRSANCTGSACTPSSAFSIRRVTSVAAISTPRLCSIVRLSGARSKRSLNVSKTITRATAAMAPWRSTTTRTLPSGF